jgi:hypothetical protein
VRFRDAEVGGQHDRALEVALGDDLEQRGRGLPCHRQISQLVNDQQPGSGEEPHAGGPPAFQRGAVAAGDQIGGGGVVGAVAGRDRGVPETDSQHRLTLWVPETRPMTLTWTFITSQSRA